MKKFQSYSGSPGTTGLKYYSYFFKKYQLDYLYQPIRVTNLEETIQHAINNGVTGFSVSMPFKKSVIAFLNQYDDLVEKFQSCNTVIIDNNRLIGFNADYYGALAISKLITGFTNVTILGNGCMGKMFAQIIPHAKVLSRSLGNWDSRYDSTEVIINCTALGTSCYESPYEMIPKTHLVIDLALKDNELKNQCAEQNVKYVSGLEFYKHNFIKQFEIYTGIQIDENEFNSV